MNRLAYRPYRRYYLPRTGRGSLGTVEENTRLYYYMWGGIVLMWIVAGLSYKALMRD
jgi:hypothetical protein